MTETDAASTGGATYKQPDREGLGWVEPGLVEPRVTLIIPTYNRAHLVGNAIESALAQEYQNLDIIVVDDGSTDETRAVLAAYQDHPRVKVLFRPVNGGVMAAKNSGLDALGSECVYFGILDSDDVLVPTAVSTLVEAAQSSDRLVSQVFGWCEDAETGEPTGTVFQRAGIIAYDDALCGRFDGEFWQIVRRDLLGGMRFDVRSGGNEGMVWWSLMKLAPALLVDHVVRRYDRSGEDRVNRPTFSRLGAERKMWGYRSMLERVGDDMRAVCPRRFADMSLEMAKWAALAGRWSDLVSATRTAHRAFPSARSLKVGLLALFPAPLLRSMYSVLYRRTR